MTAKTYTCKYEIAPTYMKYVIGENRCNLTELYKTYPTVKFSKLYSNGNGNIDSGFYLESPSLVTLENVKKSLYKLVINAESISNQNSIRKRTLKERYTRQHQYEAAEKLRKAFEADVSLQTTEPLECEVIVTDDNVEKNIKTKLIDHNNPFSLLDEE